MDGSDAARDSEAQTPRTTGVDLPDRDGTGVVLVADVGAGNAPSHQETDRLRRALPGIRILRAEPDEDLPATLRRAASDGRTLGVAGGNGTASVGAQVAAEADIPLALVPAGTLNHLARDLGMHVHSAEGLAPVRRERLDEGLLDVRFVDAEHPWARSRVFLSILTGRLGRSGAYERWTPGSSTSARTRGRSVWRGMARRGRDPRSSRCASGRAPCSSSRPDAVACGSRRRVDLLLCTHPARTPRGRRCLPRRGDRGGHLR